MKRFTYILACAALTAALYSCSNEIDGVDDAATTQITSEDITVAPFPGFSNAQTRSNDAGAGYDKASWSDGDVIYIQLNGKDSWYPMEYNDGKWSLTKDFPGMSRDDKYKAVYAPNYEPDANDGSTLVKKSDAQVSTAEYLTCEGTKPINISFKRDYARIRIYTGGVKSSYYLTIHQDKFTTNDGEETPDYFTLTPDENGNSFIYGTWSDGTSIKVDLSGNYQTSDYLYLSPVTGNNVTTKAASTANRSYSIDASYVTLDLSKATATILDWSSFAENGITKVKMIGAWNNSYQHSFNNQNSSGNIKITSIDLSEATGMENVTLPMMFCYGCTGLIEVKLPDNLPHIPSYAFSGCSSLESINIPSKATYLRNYVFENCIKLSTIEIPEGLTNIYTRAFSGCTSLSKVICRATTPPTLNTLAFHETPSDKTLYVPDSALDAYKASTNWSAAFGENIKSLLDLPTEE
jgi:hypothetical protein